MTSSTSIKSWSLVNGALLPGDLIIPECDNAGINRLVETRGANQRRTCSSPMALRECRVTFRDVRDIQHSVVVHAETTMDAAALGLKRICEQQFVMEDLADPVTVELVTSTQHRVSLKKVIDWMAHAGGTSPKEIAMKARVREG
jgi:hypothetical protein